MKFIFLPRLEMQMDSIEAGSRQIDSAETALRFVVEIESGEINQIFDAAVAATDAAFVRKLRPFQEAMEAHIAYLVERLPQLSPRLMPAAKELQVKFPRLPKAGV